MQYGFSGRFLAAGLGLLAMGSLSACHRDPDAGAHFHIRMHPMVFAQIDGNLLGEVGYETTVMPDSRDPSGYRQIPNPNGVHVEDEGPKDADGIRHADVWIFPGDKPDEELRVHFVYGAQQFDDSFDRDVRVEVPKPYTVRIDGMSVVVTQQLASATILAAYAEMVRRVEAQDDPAFARAPVAEAINKMKPFNDMPPPAGALTAARPTRPAGSAGVGGSNPWAP